MPEHIDKTRTKKSAQPFKKFENQIDLFATKTLVEQKNEALQTAFGHIKLLETEIERLRLERQLLMELLTNLVSGKNHG